MVVNVVAQLTDVLFGKILDAGVGIDPGRLDDVVGNVASNAVDIRQGDLDSLLTGKVDACDSCHS